MAHRSVHRGQPADPLDGFQPTSPTPTRLESLLGLGLEAEDLATALGVTPTTVRNWIRGTATPRREAIRVVDDLRRVVVVLAEAKIVGSEAAEWLRSRQGDPLEDDERPLDAVRADPVRVLALAHAAVLAFEEQQEPELKLVSS